MRVVIVLFVISVWYFICRLLINSILPDELVTTPAKQTTLRWHQSAAASLFCLVIIGGIFLLTRIAAYLVAIGITSAITNTADATELQDQYSGMWGLTSYVVASILTVFWPVMRLVRLARARQCLQENQTSMT